MVPLHQSDSDERDEGPGKSATAFFAMPVPKRKEPEPEPPPAAPPPMAGPPGGMPPGMSPMMGAPPMMGGMPPMMGGVGIQGPVAGPMGGPPAGYGMGGMSMPPPDPEIDRARSYRVFAVVAGLMLMVCTAIVLMAGLTVTAMMMQDDGPATNTVAAAPVPAPRKGPIEDTGRIKGPAPAPVPATRPRPTGGAAPSPSPSPAPAPTPPPAPVGPATATIKISGSDPFTGVEISCPISGFRERATFAGGVATIPNTPQEDCQVTFKGGPPARNTIRGGQTKTCTFPSGQAVCD